MRKHYSFLIVLLFFTYVYAQNQQFIGIGNLKYFEKAYPDITFIRHYDAEVDDWLISIKVPDTPGDKEGPGKTTDLYWANGSFLPASELKNKEKYWSLLYSYPKQLIDPETYTEEQKEQIKNFASAESRQNGAGTPMFFFETIYNAQTRRELETKIVRIKFLDKMTNVHKRMEAPLRNVEKKILELAETDQEVKTFLANMKSCDAYYWRIIEGTNRKSFHSLGIAMDILPKSQEGKQIFWSWAKSKYPNTWMLIPLKNRWMPPESVIKIFEEEGFIWGGKWVIYDNMHFEYHPELIQYNFK